MWRQMILFKSLLVSLFISLSLFVSSAKASPVKASSDLVLSFDPELNELSINLPADMLPATDSAIPKFLSTRTTLEGRVSLSGQLPAIARPDAAFGLAEGGAFLFGGLDWLNTSELRPRRLKLTSPEEYPGLSTAAQVQEWQVNGDYNVEYALTPDQDFSQLHIFFGPYKINSARLTLNDKSVELRTYFKAENQTDSEPFLQAASSYIERYSEQVGDYPFEQFSIVSAPIPVGLGLDRMTYVSEQILGHSYMLGRSLAHEVLHSWWGSGVIVDYEQGNWAEGLTTYMADYALAEEQSEVKAKEMRRGWLQALNRLEQYEPLSRFRYASIRSDQSVGYGKSAMLFHMLRQQLGDKAFYEGLRRYWSSSKGSTAGWAQLQTALESESTNELSGFFEFWLSTTDLPRYSVELADQTKTQQGYSIRLAISAENAPRSGSLPIQLITTESAEIYWVKYSGSTSEVEVKVASEVDSLVLDPNFEILRRLDRP